MTFSDFVKKYNLKNNATSKMKINEVLKKIGLDSKVGVFLRDGPFLSDNGVVNLHPKKGTHWVCFIHQIYFDSYGVVCPKKLSKFIIK